MICLVCDGLQVGKAQSAEVSMNPLGRQFQDVDGVVSKRGVHMADKVWMVVSGTPWRSKG